MNTRLQHNLITISEMSREINTTYGRMLAAVRGRHVDAPTHTVDGLPRRYYHASELPTIKEQFDTRYIPSTHKARENPQTLKFQEIQEQGFYSIESAATYFDMPVDTFRKWYDKGQIPQPTRWEKKFRYPLYNKSDLEQIREIKAEYFNKRSQ